MTYEEALAKAKKEAEEKTFKREKSRIAWIEARVGAILSRYKNVRTKG